MKDDLLLRKISDSGCDGVPAHFSPCLCKTFDFRVTDNLDSNFVPGLLWEALARMLCRAVPDTSRPRPNPTRDCGRDI